MAERHFKEQQQHTTEYLLPYFSKHIPEFRSLKLLEIGCAEAGFVDVLHRMGMNVRGVELSASRVATAKSNNPELKVQVGDITDETIAEQLAERYDMIVLREVIEHVPNREAAFRNISRLLKPGGYLYITFPPRYSGFAGHQQVGQSLMRYMPFVHLLPNALIRLLGKLLGENRQSIEGIITCYNEGISIGSFEAYTKKFGFLPLVKELFLFRPIYRIRFKLNPLRVPNVPLVRELMAFGYETLLRKQA